MRKLIWTATVTFPPHFLNLRGVLSAQCKSSRAELMRRLLADDPVWHQPNVVLSRRPMLAKRKFRSGLAITYQPPTGAVF
jgi:hypothetical protein